MRSVTTAIAVIAFAAVGLSNDSTGEYCNSLFWVIFISLTLSWISAITITPLLSSMLFSPKPVVEGVKNDPYGGPIFSAYRRLLALSLRWRGTVMVLSIVAFIAALYGFGYVSQSFFPPATRPQFMVDVFLPAGTHRACPRHEFGRSGRRPRYHRPNSDINVTDTRAVNN